MNIFTLYINTLNVAKIIILQSNFFFLLNLMNASLVITPLPSGSQFKIISLISAGVTSSLSYSAQDIKSSGEI